MKYSTDELLKILQNSKTYPETALQDQVEVSSLSVSQALQQLLDTKNITRSDCIRASELDRVYAYQIFEGLKTLEEMSNQTATSNAEQKQPKA